MKQQTWDAIVIGAGPAGLSAAQALGRSLRRTVVIDAGSPRNRFASHMHNILGNDGTPPYELNARGKAEAESYGVEFVASAVLRVSDTEQSVVVELADGQRLVGRALIVATGISDVLAETPGLAEYWGSSVFYCPYCHGWEVRGKRLAVIASSPEMLHQIKLMRQWSDKIVAFTAGLGGLSGDDERALLARGIIIESDPVAELRGNGTEVTSVVTVSGREYEIDAVFTKGKTVPHDGFLAELGLERSDSSGGRFLAVDQKQRTSHPRIWAAGNVTNPAVSVPLAMGSGTFTGAAVNAALVDEDFAQAVTATHHAAGHQADSEGAPESPNSAAYLATQISDGTPAHSPDRSRTHGDKSLAAGLSPIDFWDRRYAESGRMWSGNVNHSISRAVTELDLKPGRSLDLGSGEGGDVLWLADRGWDATGIELSQVAVERARAEAATRGLPLNRAAFICGDLATWVDRPAEIDGAMGRFDLVTASFLQSPVELPRELILRAAAARVAPGGYVIVVAHGSQPPWAQQRAETDGQNHHHAEFPTPQGELEALALDPKEWEILTAELWTREVTAPEGETVDLDDTVIIARRRD